MFENPGFMPHIHCYLDTPSLVATMVVTDSLIGLAYICISITLWLLIRKIQLPFSFIVVCFGAFIGACGATHFMEVWTLWYPHYWLSAAAKVVTAMASVGTGIYLYRLRHVLFAFAEAVRVSEKRRMDLEALTGDMENRIVDRTRELEKLSSRFMRVSSVTDVGVWYCDLPFDVLVWSKKTREHFWMPEDTKVTIEDFYAHIHPDDRQPTRSAIENSIQNRQGYDIEYRTIHPDHPEICKWIRAIGWTVYGDDGSPTSFDGITLDLTERKRKEAEQEQLQTDLSDLLERTSDGFFIVDTKWRITYANPITKSFFAASNSEAAVLGRTLQELFPSPDRAKFMRHFVDLAKTGQPVRFEETYEGQVLQVHAYRTQDKCTAVFFRDATERVQASNRLRESEKRYSTLTEAIPQLVWTCAADGNCTYLSRQWEIYTGIPSEQQMNYGWLDRVIHPEDRTRVLEHWLESVAEKHPYDLEYRIRRFDGEYRWFQVRGTAVRDEQGKISYWVGTCTDVQNQKLLFQQLNESKVIAESANEAKTQFLANMSHEIRTPIGAITGFADMLNGIGHSQSDKQTFSMIIQRNSRHLLRLIDDILDLSKVEAGKIAFESIRFDLGEFLTDFAAVMSLKSAEKGVRFSLNVNSLIPDFVIGDPLRLKQILSNVAGNAIKFTSKGGVTTDLDYTDEILTVRVTDTGVGIPAENVENLFKAFSQGDSSMTRKFGGTGLGLILSKHLANTFGGDLVLESSEVGRGSCFRVTVNLTASPGAKFSRFLVSPYVEELIASQDLKSGILEGVTLLLVEDSADNRTLISTYLKATGVNMLLARDGQEGYQSAMKYRPDIVLMDIQMPRMDGHEATQKLRAADFRSPVIALTAHAMQEERDRCVASGFSDYLTKPVQRDHLVELILKHAAPMKDANAKS